MRAISIWRDTADCALPEVNAIRAALLSFALLAMAFSGQPNRSVGVTILLTVSSLLASDSRLNWMSTCASGVDGARDKSTTWISSRFTPHLSAAWNANSRDRSACCDRSVTHKTFPALIPAPTPASIEQVAMRAPLSTSAFRIAALIEPVHASPATGRVIPASLDTENQGP